MRRPPRDPGEPLFSGPMIVWGLLQGALTLAVVATIYVMAIQRGMPENEMRALTFFSLVVSIVALIFVNRSTSASLIKAILRPNRALAIVLPIVVAALAVTLLWPVASGLFRFGPLRAGDLAVVLGAGVLVLVMLELLKPLWRALFSNRPDTPNAAGVSPPLRRAEDDLMIGNTGHLRTRHQLNR